jgi:hypothetical protein
MRKSELRPHLPSRANSGSTCVRVQLTRSFVRRQTYSLGSQDPDSKQSAARQLRWRYAA